MTLCYITGYESAGTFYPLLFPCSWLVCLKRNPFADFGSDNKALKLNDIHIC